MTLRAQAGLGLVLAVLMGGAGTGGAGDTGAAVPPRDLHDLHESYAELAIEGRTVAGRLRFFKKDLERALGPILDADQLALTPGPEADALVLRYLGDHLALVAHGDTLPARILRAEEIRLGHHPGWQVTAAWEATTPIDALHVRNTLLFELNDDQRNVMRFVRFPEESRVTVTTEVGKETAVVEGERGSS